ncbi:hypothetical protein VTO42DRAFT_3473 [Malbranchea cinnamomea]
MWLTRVDSDKMRLFLCRIEVMELPEGAGRKLEAMGHSDSVVSGTDRCVFWGPVASVNECFDSLIYVSGCKCASYQRGLAISQVVARCEPALS